MQRLPYILMGTGFLVLAIATSVWFISPFLFANSQIGMRRIEGGLSLWESHKEIKFKNYLKITLFNVNNPEEVLKGEKPVVNEVGPYVYEQKRTRHTLEVNEQNDTLKYKDHVEYFFRPELSTGSEDDVVTIINLPWVGLAQEMSQMSTISRLLVMGIVSRYNESVFMSRPVGELLFGGYYHHIIATFASITGESYMPNNTFGLFYGRNNTYYEAREISLGSSNVLKFGNTLKWKNESEMGWWPRDDKCNKISGSDWNLFHPQVQRDTTLLYFADDLCRNLKFVYQKDVYVDGISGYKFVIPKSQFEDPRENPDNMCYCTNPGKDLENCPKNGAYQINACSKGASILLSSPHFYQGDEEYLNKVNGLHPTQELHESFIDIEPATGQVLKSSKKIQVNLHLKPLRSVSEFRKVPNVIFPVMWTDETSELLEPELNELRSQMQLSTGSIMQLGSVSLLAAGFVLVAFGLVVFLMRIRKKPYPV